MRRSALEKALASGPDFTGCFIDLVCHGQRYVFVADEAQLPELLAIAKRYAADPEHSFDWQACFAVRQFVRELYPELGL